MCRSREGVVEETEVKEKEGEGEVGIDRDEGWNAEVRKQGLDQVVLAGSMWKQS